MNLLLLHSDIRGADAEKYRVWSRQWLLILAICAVCLQFVGKVHKHLELQWWWSASTSLLLRYSTFILSPGTAKSKYKVSTNGKHTVNTNGKHQLQAHSEHQHRVHSKHQHRAHTELNTLVQAHSEAVRLQPIGAIQCDLCARRDNPSQRADQVGRDLCSRWHSTNSSNQLHTFCIT